MSKQTIVDINGTKYIIDAFKGLEGWTYLPKVTKFVFLLFLAMFNKKKVESLLSKRSEMVTLIKKLLTLLMKKR